MPNLKDRNKVLNILLVEDDQSDIDITLRAFKKADQKNNILVVNNGEDALNYIFRAGQFTDVEKFPDPDLILLDLNLPGLTGFQVLEKIKSSGEYSQIPVVILTSSLNEEDINKSYKLGCTSYINKPINYEHFLEVVNLFLQYWHKVSMLPNNNEWRVK